MLTPLSLCYMFQSSKEHPQGLLVHSVSRVNTVRVQMSKSGSQINKFPFSREHPEEVLIHFASQVNKICVKTYNTRRYLLVRQFDINKEKYVLKNTSEMPFENLEPFFGENSTISCSFHYYYRI
jgi:hypothetical protein